MNKPLHSPAIMQCNTIKGQHKHNCYMAEGDTCMIYNSKGLRICDSKQAVAYANTLICL